MSIVTVFCVRDPDASNEYDYDAPEGIEVRFITLDRGGVFDGSPRNEWEARDAVEMANDLREGVAHLPAENALRQRVMGIAEELRDEASEYLDDDEVYDDGKTLIAGVLYDNETGEEADPQ